MDAHDRAAELPLAQPTPEEARDRALARFLRREDQFNWPADLTADHREQMAAIAFYWAHPEVTPMALARALMAMVDTAAVPRVVPPPVPTSDMIRAGIDEIGEMPYGVRRRSALVEAIWTRMFEAAPAGGGHDLQEALSFIEAFRAGSGQWPTMALWLHVDDERHDAKLELRQVRDRLALAEIAVDTALNVARLEVAAAPTVLHMRGLSEEEMEQLRKAFLDKGAWGQPIIQESFGHFENRMLPAVAPRSRGLTEQPEPADLSPHELRTLSQVVPQVAINTADMVARGGLPADHPMVRTFAGELYDSAGAMEGVA